MDDDHRGRAVGAAGARAVVGRGMPHRRGIIRAGRGLPVGERVVRDGGIGVEGRTTPGPVDGYIYTDRSCRQRVALG